MQYQNPSNSDPGAPSRNGNPDGPRSGLHAAPAPRLTPHRPSSQRLAQPTTTAARAHPSEPSLAVGRVIPKQTPPSLPTLIHVFVFARPPQPTGEAAQSLQATSTSKPGIAQKLPRSDKARDRPPQATTMASWWMLGSSAEVGRPFCRQERGGVHPPCGIHLGPSGVALGLLWGRSGVGLGSNRGDLRSSRPDVGSL